MHYQLHFHHLWIISTTISPFLFLTLHKILPVSSLREQMKWSIIFLSFACCVFLQFSPFFLVLNTGVSVNSLSSPPPSEAVSRSSVPCIPCFLFLLIYCSIKVPTLTLQTCFCASQQNCPWTQHTFPLPTPSPFSLALSSHYNCWREFYSSNSVLDPFPTCLGFYSSNSNLSFVPYRSIAVVKVTKWPAFVNSFFILDASCTDNVFFLKLLSPFVSMAGLSWFLPVSLLSFQVPHEMSSSQPLIFCCVFSGLCPLSFSLSLPVSIILSLWISWIINYLVDSSIYFSVSPVGWDSSDQMEIFTSTSTFWAGCD